MAIGIILKADKANVMMPMVMPPILRVTQQQHLLTHGMIFDGPAAPLLLLEVAITAGRVGSFFFLQQLQDPSGYLPKSHIDVPTLYERPAHPPFTLLEAKGCMTGHPKCSVKYNS
jgi:hypothetical protein